MIIHIYFFGKKTCKFFWQFVYVQDKFFDPQIYQKTCYNSWGPDRLFLFPKMCFCHEYWLVKRLSGTFFLFLSRTHFLILPVKSTDITPREKVPQWIATKEIYETLMKIRPHLERANVLCVFFQVLSTVGSSRIPWFTNIPLRN